MDDRELLELAAKANDMHPDSYGYSSLGVMELAVHGVPHCGFTGPIWNPLTDDGDALRLAVKKSLFTSDRYGLFKRFFREEIDRDLKPSEATRRAIVRAAAMLAREWEG